MKTKLLIILIAIFSFAFSCEQDEVQKTEQGCECRKMYYEKQLVTGGFQFVYTHRDTWSSVDCSIKEIGTLQPNGFIWTGFYPIDTEHNYRWECKNE